MAGEQDSVPLESFLAQGWAPLAAVKTLAATRNFRAQYSGAEWAAEAAVMRERMQAATATGAAMAGQITNKTEAAPIEEAGQPIQPQGEEVTAAVEEDEAHQEEAGGIGESNEVAQKAKASGLIGNLTSDEEIARVTGDSLTDIGTFTEEQAGVIWDEYGGGPLEFEDARGILADMLEGGNRSVAVSGIDTLERGISNEGIPYKQRYKEAVRQAARILSRVAGSASSRSDFAQSLSAGYAAGWQIEIQELTNNLLAHRKGANHENSPVLIFTDENGEPKARANKGNHLEGAARAAASDGSGSPRTAAQEREAIAAGGVFGRGKLAVSFFSKFQDYAAENGLTLDPEAFESTVLIRKVLGEGAEHTVWHDQKSNRVIKLTHPDMVGAGNVGAHWSVRDYLQSAYLANKLFKTGVRFEGLVQLDGALPQIVISQPFIEGKPATVAQIRDYVVQRPRGPICIQPFVQVVPDRSRLLLSEGARNRRSTGCIKSDRRG